MRPKKEGLKKVSVTFDLANENDKKIVDQITAYAEEFNQKMKAIYAEKKHKTPQMNEGNALKNFIDTRGELHLINDIINSLDDEKFYDYAYQAHCKKTGTEIGKYNFFRHELPKLKDIELRKLVQSLLI